MENNFKEKTNWKLLVSMLLVSILQLVGIFYAWVLIYINGLDTFSLKLAITGMIIAGVAMILPLPFWIFLRKTRKIYIFSFNIIVSLLVALWLIALLISFGSSTIQQRQEQKAFQEKTSEETATAKIEYDKISQETKSIKIVGWKDNNAGTNLLITDKDFFIHLNTSYIPEIVDYLNKNVIGQQVDIVLPNFVSGAYPVYFFSSAWICQCDLLVNGQPVQPILTNMLQKIFKERSLQKSNINQ